MTMTVILNTIQIVFILGLIFIVMKEMGNLRRASKAIDMLEEVADNYLKELGEVTRISKLLRGKEDETLEEKLHSENLNHANEEE